MPLSSKSVIPALAIVFAIALCASDVLAQGPGRGGRQRGARGGGPGGGVSADQLLRSEAVQNELEMTEEQKESLKEMAGNGPRMDRDAIRAELEGLSDEERADKIKEMRASREKERMEKLEEVLLPHQMERLQQISVQAAARGGARALMSGKLAEELGITDDQKEELREKSEELQKEFQEKVNELRAEMQKKLVESLTSEQQAKLKEISGEDFTFEQPQRGDRFAGGMRGGQQGRRGGAGGRRGGGQDRGGQRGGRRGNRGEGDGATDGA